MQRLTPNFCSGILSRVCLHYTSCNVRSSHVVMRRDFSSSSWNAKTNDALKLLNLDDPKYYAETDISDCLSLKELRTAYFRAAKRCHPDAIRSSGDTSKDKNTEQDSSERFLMVTEAYEFLLATAIGSAANDRSIISKNEESIFRRNCQDWLGIPADVVEESKRCPLFRQWLKGNTDAAFHWKIFLMQNGGLAPRLREYLKLGAGKTNHSAVSPKNISRRKRSR